jgi:hypothetical protein
MDERWVQTRRPGVPVISTGLSTFLPLRSVASLHLAHKYTATQPSTTPNVDVFKYLPAVGALDLVIGLVCPFDVLGLREREIFLSCVVFPTFLFHKT